MIQPCKLGSRRARAASNWIMMGEERKSNLRIGLLAICALTALSWARPAEAQVSQQPGAIEGTIVLSPSQEPVHHVSVLLPRLGLSTTTDETGHFRFSDIPPGVWDVVAHLHPLTDQRQTVTVAAGETVTATIALEFGRRHEEVTVTASGEEQTRLETFSSVTTRESSELTVKSAGGLGDLLENETGVAKRSFGPGTTRPVIRGFDGDRVLVMQNGISTGTLSSQSGDHGEPVDASNIERIEVVRGPATLLYGSSALGGAVNVIDRHHILHQHPHSGIRGQVTGMGGSANAFGGGSGNFELGSGKWVLWGGGSHQRTGDYKTPAGVVENSATRTSTAHGGLGRYGDWAFLSADLFYAEGRYGVPYDAPSHGEQPATIPGQAPGDSPKSVGSRWLGGARRTEATPDDHEDVQLGWRRYNLRIEGGLKKIPRYFETFTVSGNYSDWNHRELLGEEVGTEFFNKQFVYRGVLEQRRAGHLSGRVGFQGLHRSYEAVGEEALAPPVTQNGIAAFALEQLDFEHFQIQFGGRLENNSYKPRGLLARSFLGLSGSVGLGLPVTQSSRFVLNYTHSFRAPAIEELYNRGPHVGNLTYEIGNPNLKGERGNGVEGSFVSQGKKLHSEFNVFYYDFANFIYLAPTGEIENGLNVADYAQAAARYVGAEARADFALAGGTWLILGMDAVDARLKRSDTPLPRIPPVRGRVGLDWAYKGLRVKPELVLSDAQTRILPTETRTAGFAVFNFAASYTFAQQSHLAHVISVNAFNLNDRLYRNHLSFIKEHAPEIGRGIRFSYSIRFF